MNKLTQKIINNDLANRVISVSQLKRLLDGTEQSRYNLVNRALKKEELLVNPHDPSQMAEKIND